MLIRNLPLLVDIAGLIIIISGLQQIGLFKFGFMQFFILIDLQADRFGFFNPANNPDESGVWVFGLRAFVNL